jgi:hypothetical protein
MIKTFTWLGLCAFSVGGLGFVVACSSDDSNPTKSTADGGVAGDDDGDDTAVPPVGECVGDATTVAQKGRVVKFGSEGEGISGATVAIGGGSFTTDADGYYCAKFAKDTAVQMTVTGPAADEGDGFYALIDSEWKLAADGDRGDTRLLPEGTAKLLLGTLTGFDDTLGVVTLLVDKVAGCTSVDGTTVTVDGQPDAKVVYFSGGLPSSSATGIAEGQNPGVVIYNLDPAKPVTLVSAGGTCKGATLPQTVTEGAGQAAFTYTGNVGVKAANTKTLSALRLFLGAP